MKRIKVMCSFFVEVELTDEQYERRYFIIEDNGCPGTGIVGAAVQAAMDVDDGFCWACRLAGQNRIVHDGSDPCRHTEMKT
jgi:hypothetical protein